MYNNKTFAFLLINQTPDPPVQTKLDDDDDEHHSSIIKAKA